LVLFGMANVKANLEKLKRAQESAAKLPLLSDALALIRTRLNEAKFADDAWDEAITHLEREIAFIKAQRTQYVREQTSQRDGCRCRAEDTRE
jgi:hypothetical protein